MAAPLTRRCLILALPGCGLTLAGTLFARATEPPLELRWDQLVPASTPKVLRPFLPPRTGPYDITGTPNPDASPPPPKQEGRWMSEKPGSLNHPPEVVASLDGKRVHIGGYVVPLDFDATKVKEFLLVPFVGACIHVPPPPPNQIIYVTTVAGLDVKGTFDPVYVTGTLRTVSASTGLADAGYTLEAERIDPRAK